jgi:hypothetical protein
MALAIAAEPLPLETDVEGEWEGDIQYLPL